MRSGWRVLRAEEGGDVLHERLYANRKLPHHRYGGKRSISDGTTLTSSVGHISDKTESAYELLYRVIQKKCRDASDLQVFFYTLQCRCASDEAFTDGNA